MSVASITIGPQDHGRQMSLKDFDRAEVQEGYLYELSRGVITLSDVPRPSHGKVVVNIRRRFVLYQEAQPRKIYGVFSGSECKLLLGDFESERHPDLAVYVDPPISDDHTVWSVWVPALVIEVVSPDSVLRDYKEKLEEYLAFGVAEYWVVDPRKKTLTVFTKRAGKVKDNVYEPGDVYECKKFKGLTIAVDEIFA